MLNCDPGDRFVDQYITLMKDSLAYMPTGADTNKITLPLNILH